MKPLALGFLELCYEQREIDFTSVFFLALGDMGPRAMSMGIGGDPCTPCEVSHTSNSHLFHLKETVFYGLKIMAAGDVSS